MPTLHQWTRASSVSPEVMTVTWWTASGIILHHRSIAYELSIYYSSLIYFSFAIAIITTKYQKHYFYYFYLLLPLPLLSYYLATKHFAADIKFPGVVELTTQLLILENILWLPLCRINRFGLNTLPSKTVAILYTCSFIAPRGNPPHHTGVGYYTTMVAWTSINLCVFVSLWARRVKPSEIASS